jgi:hypothetical protein
MLTIEANLLEFYEYSTGNVSTMMGNLALNSAVFWV